MKCRAAVIRGVGMDWEIREIDLDPPRNGEVLVRMAVAGICHSDDHLFTGDVVPTPEVLAHHPRTAHRLCSESPGGQHISFVAAPCLPLMRARRT